MVQYVIVYNYLNLNIYFKEQFFFYTLSWVHYAVVYIKFNLLI